VARSAAAAAEETPRGTSAVEALRTVTRDVQLRLAEALAASGHHGLRPSYAPLLERVREGALPIGRIAADLGVSPQATSRTARSLEELGYVARTTSATDGRSKLVTLTQRGHALLECAHGTFAACERSYALLVGPAPVERIVRDLEVLHFGLGLTPQPGTVVPTPGPRSIGTSVLVTLHATHQVRRALASRRHGALRPSHLELLLTMGPGGSRVSDAARSLRISRQAVSAMVSDLEDLGYLRRHADRTDGRAVIVTPTARGASVLDEMATANRGVEENARAALGAARWTRLQRDLAGLAQAISATAPLGEQGRRPGRAVSATASSLDVPRLAAWLRERLGVADATHLGSLLAEPAPRPRRPAPRAAGRATTTAAGRPRRPGS